MKWDQLLCEERQRTHSTSNTSDNRNEFQKDYHRIICSASFRRLQDKTQVFPLDNSDFVRTRLTHSLEVSSFAKSLGQMAFQYLFKSERYDITATIKENCCSILECAGLLHDIGNPPFGHFGEESIRNWFKENIGKLKYKDKSVKDYLDEQMVTDLLNFEGNAQALRLLTKLHFLVDENGMNLTYALLNTLIKYPVSSIEINKDSEDIKYHKMGYYFSEKDLFEKITKSTGAVGCRYPLTFLLEAADDIAYKTADIEDAVKKGIISYDLLLSELKNKKYMNKCSSKNELSYYNSCIEWLENKYVDARRRRISNPELNAVQNWVIKIQGFLLRRASFGFTNNYNEIMAGEFGKDIISVSHGNAISYALGDIAYRYVFRSKQILTSEIAAGNIINFLLDKFVQAAIHIDTEGLKLTPMEDRLISIISENYMQIYNLYSNEKDEKNKLYLRLLLVTDYICGMTDSFAKRLYQELSGIN